MAVESDRVGAFSIQKDIILYYFDCPLVAGRLFMIQETGAGCSYCFGIARTVVEILCCLGDVREGTENIR
jgi:hypothetical protein